MAKMNTHEDRAVCRYIDDHQTKDDYYDEEISQEELLDIHFHLSSLRRGIISWYDFKPGASLLELGAGFGALTGFLCESCTEVTAVEESALRAEALAKRHRQYSNLKVRTGKWQEMTFEGLFDYVVVFDSAQCDVSVLNQMAGLLKPQGKLLISFQNCFGLKYLCGMPERHTGEFYGGIKGYLGRAEEKSFSRNEICRVMEASVFSEYKFYYPLPDDRFPQLIYTDASLPEKNVSERLLAYHEKADILLRREDKIYGKVIEQGDFPFLADSFLVECTKEGRCCDVSYAAISADRGKERAFATSIHQSGIVYKQPLYPEGKTSAQRIYDHTLDLIAHQIPIVPHAYEKGRISLSYIPLPTLADYLRETAKHDKGVFLNILRDLHAFILQSSEETDASDNALIPRLVGESGKEVEDTAYLQKLDWGPILKKAYIELVPLNCFYKKETGEYLFFDQEFVRENYPAGYVLFRAIAISYVFIPGMEECIPLQQMKDEFGLDQVWEYYQKEEALFLDEVRLRKRYSRILNWDSSEQVCSFDDFSMLQYNAGRRSGRELVLFGTGKVFEEYCKNYGGSDVPAFAVDNDSSKWGQTSNGVEIRPPQAILEIPREKRQVLICTRKTDQIEEQLREMDVREYWKYQDVIE